MRTFFAYTRVSTAKQGEGVSLEAQKEAIDRFASREGLVVSEWFEEKVTAAKRGRPAFTRMMKQLKAGKAQGVIMHKIDRGARNLRDWADLAELIDQGIQIHFANESLDLQSRGGRLSADIQAVVAADYIRNLREETKKGMDGRLKQGLYPYRAPHGYQNNGKGKLKTIDPVTGPLIRQAFELYATGQWSLKTLTEELYERGLRGFNGTKLTTTGLNRVLRNPFYKGIMLVRTTGESFPGKHEPLVSSRLFDRVQTWLDSKRAPMNQKHHFTYSRLLQCSLCGYTLVGERQKSYIYYRCHRSTCPMTSIRQNRLEKEVLKKMEEIAFSPSDWTKLKVIIERHRQKALTEQDQSVQTLQMQHAKVEARLRRLTDEYLDETIEKTMYLARISHPRQEKGPLFLV